MVGNEKPENISENIQDAPFVGMQLEIAM